MKNIIDRNKNITSNSKQIELLKKNFPNCFDKNGKFQINKFNEIVKDEFDITNEGYKLDWLGKSYARLLANQEVTTSLTEDLEHNQKEENKNSSNLYIEGDNLEVLKHMTHAYSEKIKMIYIDPPYNTGTDFIYQDDRKFTPEELSKLAKIDIDESKRILEFTNSKSNSHSAWLTFMYPRLYVARELLKEDGVIFISIDDNEQAQLKLLCDEVFGEENFIANIIRRTRVGGGAMSKYISSDHENTLVYSKMKSNLNKLFRPYSEKNLIRYKNCDEKGHYFWDTFMRNRQGSSNNYEITCPDGSTLRGNFLYKKDKFQNLLDEGDIKFIKNKDMWSLQIKQRMGLEGMIYRSLVMDNPNQDGTQQISNLLGKEIFSYPKPTQFIRDILYAVCKCNEIILDFFSGSATTAHAVHELNASDGGNRKFIMVNIPESIDVKNNKEAYDFCINELKQEPVITTIGKERIKRAAKKIILDNEALLKSEKTKGEYKDLSGIDFGFKVYKTISAIETNYFKELDILDLNSNKLIINNNLNDLDLKDLLLSWKLHDGIEFNVEVEEIKFNEYVGYVVEDKLYLLRKGFGNKEIKLFLEKLDSDEKFMVRKIIILGVNFLSKELMELEEAVKAYKNRKNIQIEIEKRY